MSFIVCKQPGGYLNLENYINQHLRTHFVYLLSTDIVLSFIY